MQQPLSGLLETWPCRMETHAVPCCFKAPVRKEGQRIVTRFQLQDDIEVRAMMPCHGGGAGQCGSVRCWRPVPWFADDAPA